MASHGSRKRSSARRLLEFSVILHHVRKNKLRLIRRLQGLVKGDGPHVLFLGSRRADGYGRVSFRRPDGRHISIDAQRVFLILALGRQIKLDHDAGHKAECEYRHCVLHLFEQPTAENSLTARARLITGQGDQEVPF